MGAYAVTRDEVEVKKRCKMVKHNLCIAVFFVSHLALKDFSQNMKLANTRCRMIILGCGTFLPIQRTRRTNYLGNFWEEVLKGVENEGADEKEGAECFTIVGDTDYFKNKYKPAAEKAHGDLKQTLVNLG